MTTVCPLVTNGNRSLEQSATMVKLAHEMMFAGVVRAQALAIPVVPVKTAMAQAVL